MHCSLSQMEIELTSVTVHFNITLVSVNETAEKEKVQKIWASLDIRINLSLVLVYVRSILITFIYHPKKAQTFFLEMFCNRVAVSIIPSSGLNCQKR